MRLSNPHVYIKDEKLVNDIPVVLVLLVDNFNIYLFLLIS